MPKETHLLKEAYKQVYAKKNEEEVIEEASSDRAAMQLSRDDLNRLLHGLKCFRPHQGLASDDHTELEARLEAAISSLGQPAARELSDNEKLQDYFQGGTSVPSQASLAAWRASHKTKSPSDYKRQAGSLY